MSPPWSRPPFPASSELLGREAAPVVVVDAVPALGVAVRPVLRVATVRVAEAFSPALAVAHDEGLGAGRGAGLPARDPARLGRAPRVPGAEPALLVVLLGAPDPVLAIGHGGAHPGAGLDLARDELVGRDAV